MAITQRKIQKTGGGSSASAVGVQQIATPKSNIGSNVQSLAKSLGVIMDTSVSPHEQAQLDKVSSDEYRKLEVSLKGKSPEEQDRLRADHRARFTEANKGGFIENLLNKPNPRLQGYNQATNTSLKYGTVDALAQLQKGFTEEHDETYRTNALIAMYDSQNAKAEGMSAEVAQQWRADAEELFDDSYVKVRNDADVLQKNQAVSLVNRATDDQLLHLTPANLVGKDDSLESSEQVTRSLNMIADDGTEVLDPKFVKKSISIVQAMRAEVKIQNPQLTTDQLNVMVNEKYKFVAETYNSPELFDAIMAETNATGMTGRELNPKFAQETSDALHEESIKKYDKLLSKQQKAVVESSKLLTDQFITDSTELQARANDGSLTDQVELEDYTSKAFDYINNNELTLSDQKKVIDQAQMITNIHKKSTANTMTNTLTDQMLSIVPADIDNLPQFMYKYRDATTEAKKLKKAQYDEYHASLEGMTKTERDLDKQIITSLIKSPTEALEDSFNAFTDERRAKLKMTVAISNAFDGYAVPTMTRELAVYHQNYLRYLKQQKVVTSDDYQVAHDEYTAKEQPKLEQRFKNKMEAYISNTIGLGKEGQGADTTASTDSEPVVSSEAKFTNTPSANTLGFRQGDVPEAKPEVNPELEAQKRDKPQEYYYKTLPQDPQRLSEELPIRLNELLPDVKPDGTVVNHLDVIGTLINDMGESGVLNGDPEGVLVNFGNIVASVLEQRGESGNAEVDQYINELFNLGFKRDEKGTVTIEQMRKVLDTPIPSHLLEGSGLAESKAKLEVLLAQFR